jgi:hypothetical protein
MLDSVRAELDDYRSAVAVYQGAASDRAASPSRVAPRVREERRGACGEVFSADKLPDGTVEDLIPRVATGGRGSGKLFKSAHVILPVLGPGFALCLSQQTKPGRGSLSVLDSDPRTATQALEERVFVASM